MRIGNFDTAEKVLIIAELSTNHGGSLDTALKTIKAAKKAGADAIKLQTYTPESLTLDCDNDDFIIKDGPWKGRKFFELYENGKTPYEWHSQLFEVAQDEGLLCFSSPFAKKDVEFLRRFDPPAYKIASFEANDENFVRFIAKEKKPTLVSTGIVDEEELQRIIAIFQEEKNTQLILLKCTSAYPALLSDMNLQALTTLQDTFKVEVGLSDHSLGTLACTMAVALGARVIEKHFILDKSIQSEDKAFSLDFTEFQTLVQTIREAESALGTGSLALDDKTRKNRIFARSLYVSKSLKKGECFSQDSIQSVRPNYGLHPKFLQKILGKKASKDLEFGMALKEGDFI
ncbi:pseudaminic acid synthase [Campylobacter sp. MIT 21-1685]|uniref:pseudaminic acid synthase n=1 Tax=unclassified Campylobacter TaxID=2593542 RepID=UPI00224B5E13|nr:MULTISPECIES: pseudaminic acid synthase [unclassified Campylobacter]MCX2683714.1 pseudaminic acid synthase [Campylobacter sp. MIT 21-1684]MCX2752020.1 pseudaminic acid synthase [Campylobacter sp. MIT 21-1682]MCX2808198.1 pseudaminic acid synthase [Campylobacter sp. MIT 21-1685]